MFGKQYGNTLNGGKKVYYQFNITDEKLKPLSEVMIKTKVCKSTFEATIQKELNNEGKVTVLVQCHKGCYNPKKKIGTVTIARVGYKSVTVNIIPKNIPNSNEDAKIEVLPIVLQPLKL